MTPAGIATLCAVYGLCPLDPYGQHNWLPWCRLDDGSYMTRCVACRKEERFGQPPDETEGR